MEFSSKLFPVLFDGVDGQQKLNVLDIGAATSQSVAFFSQFRCKLFFADLLSSTAVPVCYDELSDDELIAAYRALLDFPEDARFDLCLFWDFFGLLDRRSMQAFSLALSPYTTPQTLAHGFGVLNNKTALSIDDYRIKNSTTLIVKPVNYRSRRLYHHSQRDFETLVEGFSIKKGTLLQNGKLEILLEGKTSGLSDLSD